MNDETNNILKEIRDLQKEAIENQKKALEQVKMTQKGATKKILIFLAIFLVILLATSFIR